MPLRTADQSRWMGCRRVGGWWGTPAGRVAVLATAHLVVAGVLSAGTSVERAADLSVPGLVGFTAAFALVGLLPLQLGMSRQAYAVTLVEAVLVAAVFMLPPAAVAASAAVGEAIAAATWRQRPMEVVWSAARTAGAAAMAAAAFDLVGATDPLAVGSWLAAGAAAATFAAVNFGSTAAVMATTDRRPFDHVVRDAVSTVLAAATVATGTGLAGVALAEAHAAGPVLLLPLAAVVIGESHRQVGARAALRHQIHLNAEKSEFVAAVSHDLRTPVTAALASIETLQRLGGRVGPETAAELLERASDHSRRLQRMVQQLLLVAAEEHGAVPVDATAVDPDELVARAAEDLTAAKHHDILVVGGSATGPVLLDTDKVWRIVENLVDNACKYAPAGAVELAVATGSERLHITVADRGPGVAPGDRERIFERYVHIDPIGSEPVEGTGLGLYLCRRLAGRLGGSVECADRPGGGSVFTLTLPLRPAPAPDPDADPVLEEMAS